jgi:hypothetical protein
LYENRTNLGSTQANLFIPEAISLEKPTPFVTHKKNKAI